MPILWKFFKKFFKLIGQIITVIVIVVMLNLVFFQSKGVMLSYLFLIFISHPLHAAVSFDSKPAIYAFSFPPFLNQKLEDLKGGCFTPLELAIQNDKIEIVQILMNRGARKTCRGNALYVASYRPDIVRYLLDEHGYDYNQIAPPYRDPPFISIVGCSYRGEMSASVKEVLEIYLKEGADPNKVALKAIERACPDAVSLALTYNADPNLVIEEITRGKKAGMNIVKEEAIRLMQPQPDASR